VKKYHGYRFEGEIENLSPAPIKATTYKEKRGTFGGLSFRNIHKEYSWGKSQKKKFIFPFC